MNWTFLSLRFRQRKTEISTAPNQTPEPITESAAEWCAGLAFTPASFSQQLYNMQTSLQNATPDKITPEVAKETVSQRQP